MKNLGFLCLFLLGACSISSDNSSTNTGEIRNTIENESGSFNLTYTSDTYRFTDRIEINLNINLTGGVLLLDSLPAEGIKWGDFLVEKKLIHSPESFSWILLPEKTGESQLTPLTVLISASEDQTSGVTFPPIQWNIQSVLLDESTKPADLILQSTPASSKRNIWILVVIAVLAGTLVSLVYFYHIKRVEGKENNRKPDCREILEEYKILISHPDFTVCDVKNQYHQVYLYLRDFIHTINPSISAGLEPNALIMELERPSGLNQWALRMLYPILKEMEEIFFNPHYVLPEGTVKDGHFKIILECMNFLEKEERSSDV